MPGTNKKGFIASFVLQVQVIKNGLMEKNFLPAEPCFDFGKPLGLFENKKSALHCLFGSLVLLTIFLSTAFAVASENEALHPWGYEGGTGPLHWGEMEQDHEKHLMCREGVRQSPIHIDHVPGLKIGSPHLHYHPTPVRLINNAHTLMLKYQEGSYLEWEGEVFDLVQLHFHHPSEHLVHGKRYPMEVHLVHKTKDHQYAVIALLARLGNTEPTLQKLWKTIPAEIDRELILQDESVDVSKLFPDSRDYYFYNGSLTTPPCTENVSWFILEEPIEISLEQINRFRSFIGDNARPVQKINHRIVVKLK